MNSHHSELLVHWTSRDLAKQSPEKAETQDAYVRLLRSIYSKGLRFSRPKDPDIVVGFNCHTMIPTLPILCFTELRFSQAQAHAHLYGGLGIGFRREFLMTCGANPVFYMQSKNQGIVNTNLAGLAQLEEEERKRRGLEVFLSYVKPMGEPCNNRYQYYEESEWRMVACTLNGQWPDLFVEEHPNVWFRFKPSDVALLAFPNHETRTKALADGELKAIFEKHGMPMLVDTSHCAEF
jgi:hypothetical protein